MYIDTNYDNVVVNFFKKAVIMQQKKLFVSIQSKINVPIIFNLVVMAKGFNFRKKYKPKRK